MSRSITTNDYATPTVTMYDTDNPNANATSMVTVTMVNSVARPAWS